MAECSQEKGMRIFSARSWKLGFRMAVGFGVILLCLVACVTASLFGLKQLSGNLQEVVKVAEDEALLARSLETEVTRSRLRRYRTVSDSPKSIDKNLKMVEESDSLIADLFAKLKAGATGERALLVSAALAGWNEYQKSDEQFQTDLRRTQDQKQGVKKLGEMRDTIKKGFEPELTKLVESSQKQVHHDELSAGSAYAAASSTLWISLALALTLSVGAAILVSRSIVLPLNQLSESMDAMQDSMETGLCRSLLAMSQGDLTFKSTSQVAKVETDREDEIGTLFQTYNKLVESFTHAQDSLLRSQEGMIAIAGAVRHATKEVGAATGSLDESLTKSTTSLRSVAATVEQVSAAAVESATSSGHIANGTGELARSIGDASGLMESVSGLLAQVSDSASRVADEAVEASANSAAGKTALESLTNSLQQMRTQSLHALSAVEDLGRRQTQIGEIVKAINDISDQTNLLALNAAIEAARAGEHGRGFAVVAEEVRKLAERAKSSTEQITQLIQSIQEGVKRTSDEMSSSAAMIEESQRSGSQAAEALVKITDSSVKVDAFAKAAHSDVTAALGKAADLNHVISDIAAVSQESAASSQQISAGLQEVAAAATDVASHTKEQFHAMQKLSALADGLSDIAGGLAISSARFKTDESSVLDQVEAFKRAHRAWVFRMEKALLFNTPVDGSKLSNDTQCALGRWTSSTGDSVFGSSPAYVSMKQEHHRLHIVCAQINSLIAQGKSDEAGSLLKELQGLSESICRALDNLTRGQTGSKAA